MVEFTARRLMALEVVALTVAGDAERSPERTNQRNGYRERRWETRAGTAPLKIPKLRKGNYLPAFLEPRRAAEKALVAVIQEAYIQRVLTRSVDDLVKAMAMSGVSKSEFSRLCVAFDEQVNAFLARPLAGDWPCVWLGATYIKVRQCGRVSSAAATVAVGANTEGRREVGGLRVGLSETESFWSEFLRSLTRRGLRGVVSDTHAGLKQAAAKVIGATWQRCRVHCMRNALSYVPKAQQPLVASDIRTTFAQDAESNAHQRWREVADSLRDSLPKLAKLMADAELDMLAHRAFHHDRRTKLHSTNPLDQLNKAIKQRTPVVAIFPNQAATIRLVGALLLEHNDE